MKLSTSLALIIIIGLSSVCMAKPLPDKNGVSPSSVVLPSGPGSLEGFGATYKWMPSINKGIANYSIVLKLPEGTSGHTPHLALKYSSSQGNGILGVGWLLDLPYVKRGIAQGLPTYSDGKLPIPEAAPLNRVDQFVTESGIALLETKKGDFFAKHEAAFVRYRRRENSWTADYPNGSRMVLGATIRHGAQTFSWLPSNLTDRYGNVINYYYKNVGEQQYLTHIEYGAGKPPWAHFYFVKFEYESRTDPIEDGRPGFLLKTTQRLKQISIGIGDETENLLIRRYEFSYEDGISLLKTVKEFGADGVTRLPHYTFKYTPAPQFQESFSVKNAVLLSEGLNIPKVNTPFIDIVDLNGDGLPDLLQTFSTKTPHRAILNRGEQKNKLLWEKPKKMRGEGKAWSVNLESGQQYTHLADFDGDGRADLGYRSIFGQQYFFRNLSTVAWGKRVLVSSDKYIPSPFSKKNLVRRVDLDGDHRIDLVKSINNGQMLKVWYCLGKKKFTAPKTVRCSGCDFNRASLADLNGDQLLDFVKISPNALRILPSIGFGRFASVRTIKFPGNVTFTDKQVKLARLIDLTGDGLADLVVGPLPGNRLKLSINQGGYSFSQWIEVTELPAPRSSDHVIRWADMNGNGSVDFVLLDSLAEAPVQVVDISNIMGAEHRSYLLSEVDNGRGHKLLITYRPSTDFMVADYREGAPWRETVPFSMPLVAEIKEIIDSTDSPQYTQYQYHNGIYFAEKHEFRGFSEVESIALGDQQFPTLVTRSFFRTGRKYEGLKGKLWKLVLEDQQGKVFEKTETQWSEPPMLLHTAIDGETVSFAHPNAINKTIIERSNSAEKKLRQTFDYDKFGNQIKHMDYGLVASSGDEQFLYTDFAINENRWLLSFPSLEKIYDANGQLVSRTDLFYDDPTFSGKNHGTIVKGNLTLTRKWINSLTFVDFERRYFDSYGNVIQVLDPLASHSSGHYRTFEYDPFFHTFPITETIYTGDNKHLVFRSDYDYRFGEITRSEAPTKAVTQFQYDTFGRLTHIYKPGDLKGYPSISYDYQLAQPNGESGFINWIETRLRDREPDNALNKLDHYFVSRRFLDGTGRALLTKHEAEPAPNDHLPRAVIVGAVTYSQRGKAVEFLSPCFSTKGLSWEKVTDPDWKCVKNQIEKGWDQLPKRKRLYDPLGREIATINPDNSRRTTTYQPLVKILADENVTKGLYGTPFTYHFDGQNQLIQIEEHPHRYHSKERTSWVTRFHYDTIGNLSKVVDALDHTKSLQYDGLNRVTQIDDPNYGKRVYQYDAASNLVTEIDGMGVQTHYLYDGANRLICEYYGSQCNKETAITYQYDLTPKGQGRLGLVKDQSGTSQFWYDQRGREIKWTRRLADLESLTTFYQYDPLDRLSVLTYPDDDYLEYQYNERNLEQSVRLGSIGTIVKQVNYNASEQPVTVQYGNSVRSLFEYDQRARLKRLSAVGITDLFYRYDPASNLRELQDNRSQVDWRNSHTQTFKYDDLYRLTEVIYPSDYWIHYNYDSIGNLISQHANIDSQNLGTLKYGNDRLFNAVRQIGEEPEIQYDNNGRVIAYDKALLIWDERERLKTYKTDKLTASYVYDYTGKRVAKEIKSDDTQKKFYVSDVYEIASDSTWKNIRLGDKLIARVKTTASASPKIEYIHSDHLGSPIIVMDAKGEVLSEHSYFPFGEPRNTSSFSRGFVGTERDNESGLLAFEARYMWGTIGRYLSPDPVLMILNEAPLSPQSLNPYAYSVNRPLTHKDPDGRFFSFIITGGFAAYDTYQYTVGNISGAEYASAMALNGAALVADLSTGGMGGGVAVRATNAVIKTAKVVTRSHSVYSGVNAAVHAGVELKKGNYGKAALMGGLSVLSMKGSGKKAAKSVAPAKRASNQTVLGHYPDYVKTSDKLGARRFEVPESAWNKMSPAEQWGANKKFLDRMISKGDEVILATPANQARSGSFYAKELGYLKSQDYKLNGDGTRMLPPGR